MKSFHYPLLVCFFFLTSIIFFFHNCYAEETIPPIKKEAPEFSSVEERRILSKMQNAQTDVDGDKNIMREKELKTLNEAVDKKLEEINLKLEELQNMQKNLKTLLAQKNAEEIKRIKELGKIYEKMTPDKAALAIANMDDKLATDLLATMKPKSAAKILNVLDRKKASELSTTFSTVK